MQKESNGCWSGWKSVEIERGSGGSSVLVLCDHATNLLPPACGSLGLGAGDLDRHIAYDIGALGVARGVAEKLEATLIFSRFSRLLIDPNRGEDDPTLIMQISDGAIVPGNAGIAEKERENRIARFYAPYHQAIAAEIDTMMNNGRVPVIVSMHSFTHIWRGMPRKWHAAVLWDKDPRLAAPLIAELRHRTGVEIGDNEPYTGKLRNDTIYRHATLRGLPNALIEVRQDLVARAEGQREWAEILAQSLAAIFSDSEHSVRLSRVERFGSHTDIGNGANKRRTP
jgi:predicted N-formylglutamate amidohydrolase